MLSICERECTCACTSIEVSAEIPVLPPLVSTSGQQNARERMQAARELRPDLEASTMFRLVCDRYDFVCGTKHENPVA
jgi:hypothetical protein